MTTKHTPGPYTVGGLQQNVRVSGHRIVGCGATVAIVISGTGRAEATSNLIAAAPDLLAALKGIIDYAERDIVEVEDLTTLGDDRSELDKALGALAFARAAIEAAQAPKPPTHPNAGWPADRRDHVGSAEVSTKPRRGRKSVS